VAPPLLQGGAFTLVSKEDAVVNEKGWLVDAKGEEGSTDTSCLAVFLFLAGSCTGGGRGAQSSGSKGSGAPIHAGASRSRASSLLGLLFLMLLFVPVFVQVFVPVFVSPLLPAFGPGFVCWTVRERRDLSMLRA
jgi:hypothetical protein